jgi:DNA topoisomerase-6 subunit B
MASVWVPFTSEAKEAIAEYEEIVEEAKRALQECGRRLGIWLHKREHAKGEFSRRNTFQRYIEEVVESCKRMKGGKLDTDRLKKQLSKIAEKITGGEETDRLLNKQKETKADVLEHVIERTSDGFIGEVPVLLKEQLNTSAPSSEAAPEQKEEMPENTKGS